MSDRSQRLFEIIQILRRASAPVSARALAQSLEVATRTIYRDIVTLQATGVPIVGEAGVGYVMRAGYDLPPLMFGADEIEAIVVGLSLLGRTGDAGLQDAAERVARKIADVLPDDAGRALEATPLLVSRWHAVPPAGADYRMMRRAIREEAKLRLRYRDADARETERTVRPIALVYYVDNVLLAAWCEMRSDFRHFRVDRIAACAQTGAHFRGEGIALRTRWQAAEARAMRELFSS
jgi:predicted DNA-binding transcriptional regulator YafY